MGYSTDGLTFNTLRGGNRARLPHFTNKHSQLAHSQPDGSDWSPAQWLQAVIGELGEYANLRKKYERGDLTASEFETEAAKELADVQCYLDILALRSLDTPAGPHPTGIDLGRATMAKFNEVSKRVGSPVRLAADDWHYVEPARLPLPTKESLLPAFQAKYGKPDRPLVTDDIRDVMWVEGHLQVQVHVYGFIDWFVVQLDSSGQPDPATIEQHPF